ncbi:MAG: CooT family nickel-binding protein [Archaeoglobi archaeon]|nr:CooT family nickel-binding protein [Archaeoglobi archaeon]
MCESKVLSADGRLLMEDVVRIKVEGSLLKMWDILGATKEVRGRILEVDLVSHRVRLEVL